MTETTNLLKAVVGLLGLLLPALVVTTLIEIPLSLAELVKIITIPTSVVAVLAIFLLGDAIRRWTIRRALIVFAICVLVGSSSAITFYLFAPRHVFLCKGERLVSPMTDSARIHDIIEPFDNDYCRALRRSPVKKELRESLATGSVATVIVMILLMVATVLFLVGAMIGIAWKAIVGTEVADAADKIAGS
ncbi:MAG: hypothetical protein ACJ8ER_12925 [Allosphingosinicella sp.]